MLVQGHRGTSCEIVLASCVEQPSSVVILDSEFVVGGREGYSARYYGRGSATFMQHADCWCGGRGSGRRFVLISVHCTSVGLRLPFSGWSPVEVPASVSKFAGPIGEEHARLAALAVARVRT